MPYLCHGWEPGPGHSEAMHLLGNINTAYELTESHGKLSAPSISIYKTRTEETTIQKHPLRFSGKPELRLAGRPGQQHLTTRGDDGRAVRDPK